MNFLESYGYIRSSEFTIYEMMKGCFVWAVRYCVDNDDFMTPLPEGWSIRSTIWSIVSKEMEEDSFLVTNLSRKVVQYSLISNTLNEIFDCRSNQLDDNHDDDELLSILKLNITFMSSFHLLQQEPDESLFRAWERFKELLMKCLWHYLTNMQEVILFYNGLDVPTRQILDSKGAIPTKTVADAKIAIQEMAEYSQKWHNRTSSKSKSTETSDGLAAIQAQLNNLWREIKKVNKKFYAAHVRCELCKGPHYTKDCQLKEEGNALEEAYYTQFGAPYKPMRQYKAAGPGFYQRNNGNSSYPDRRQTVNLTAYPKVWDMAY
nr:hypothetical protein [Tanacetum cinerariifolium]